MDRKNQHIIVLGAGIGGLSAAYFLAARGARQITILEEEPTTFARASGHNAAIYRPLETDEVLVTLAADSATILEQLETSSETPLIERRGLLMVDDVTAHLERMQKNAHMHGIQAELLDAASSTRLVPGLTLNSNQNGLWTRQGGVLDPHAIGQALCKALARFDLKVRVERKVDRLLVGGQGQCVGVELGSGERLRADAVVLSAGAASGPLALGVAAPLPLLPLQRHLAILDAEQADSLRDAPVVWQLNPEVYFRAESGGVLVSPCDETPKRDGLAQSDVEALSPLTERLRPLYPGLATAKVRRFWACIRTKAPDTRPIVGQAPQVPGLYFLAGLAGFGMSCGLSCGRLLAACLYEGETTEPLSPERLYLPFLGGGSSCNMRRAGVSRSSI